MGRKLDSAAYMSGLRRTMSGQFSIDDASNALELKKWNVRMLRNLLFQIEKLTVAQD